LHCKTKLVETFYIFIMTKEEKIKNEAIQASTILFQQYGYQKTTMEDIAKAMRRGKSTLYYYFKSKDEIFDAVLENEINEVFFTTRSAVEKASTAEEKLKIYFLVSLNSIMSKANLYKIMRGELTSDYSNINLRIKKFNAREIQAVKEILLLGIKNKEFISSLKIEDVDLLSYSAVNASRNLSVDLIIEDKFPDWAERLNFLINVVIQGIKV
jgi:AcrR family transcriptional regulator